MEQILFDSDGNILESIDNITNQANGNADLYALPSALWIFFFVGFSLTQGDLSRFGRDYLTVGRYTDIIFPSLDVRFIAINDRVDSEKGDADGFSAIRNLFNEWYPRDTSKKIRAVFRQKGTSGKHIGNPVFGYRLDPEDKDHWIVDEEAAAVVKRIFDLTIAGKGPTQIARTLEQEKVLTISAYYAKNPEQNKHLKEPEDPYRWSDHSVIRVLENMEYTGCTCNFKTYSKSYKLKKRFPNAVEDMCIFPNTQEAIIPQAQWDRVQELRKNKRRNTKAERQGLFSGLLFCADCGSKLHFATSKSFEGRQDHYVCSNYKSNRGEKAENDMDSFIALTKKYVDVTELTPTIVNEYIKKIIVYAPDKSTGKRQQKLKIIFNFVDEVEIQSISEPIVYKHQSTNRKTA